MHGTADRPHSFQRQTSNPPTTFSAITPSRVLRRPIYSVPIACITSFEVGSAVHRTWVISAPETPP
jgi:hypothetical protein